MLSHAITIGSLMAGALLGLAPAVADSGGWQISEDRSPLTNAVAVSAILNSERDLTNMIGAPAKAALVLRCKDNAVAVYVSWPEVLNNDGTNFVGQPKTLAIWRRDEAKLESNFWSISNDGTAAGEFSSKSAIKLMRSFAAAKRLAVRLSGRMTQDAGFDLAGIDQVAVRVASACGLGDTGR